MAIMFSVSLSDPEIIKWIESMKKANDGKFPYSPSQIFRDALFIKKRELEIQGEQDIKELIRKIKAWKEVVEKQREFIEKKGLMDQFVESEKKVFDTQPITEINKELKIK